MRKLFLIIFAVLLAAPLEAHTVVWPGNSTYPGSWPGNPFAFTPQNPLLLVFDSVPSDPNGPGQPISTVTIKPSSGEDCTVVVNATIPVGSPFFAAYSSSAALEIQIDVIAGSAPLNGVEQQGQITGEWHATGLTVAGIPDPFNCTATSPNSFIVPIRVRLALTGAEQPNSAFSADPISTSSGEVTESAVDLALGGPLPLTFRRYYASMLNTAGNTSSLGPNWMHNFEQTLSIAGNTTTVTATILLYGGKVVKFQQSGAAWQLISNEKYDYQLISVGGGYQFLDLPKGRIYNFSNTGALTSIQDRNGNAWTITPGTSGPASVTDGLGRTLAFAYNGAKLVSVTDQTGRSVSYAYTGQDLTAVTDSLGRITNYTYTTVGSKTTMMVSETKPVGNKPVTHAFDASSRANRETDSLGNITTVAYDTPSAGVTTVTDALNAVIQHTYQTPGNVSGFTDAAGQSGSIASDSNNRRTSLTDKLGDTNSVTYHVPSGYVASVKDALGNTTSYTYAAQAQGSFTFFNLTNVAYPDGSSSSMTFDSSGNVLSSVDRAGKITAYTYNTRGQVLTRTNPAGGVTTYTYNTDGTLASVQSPAKDTSTLAYDAKKRPSLITYPDGSSKSSSYDNRDNILTITDERGKTGTFTYDANNKLKTATDPTTKPNAYAYDTNDRLASFTDRLGKVANYAYDPVGDLKTFTNAAVEPTTFGYDAQRHLTSVVDSSGKGNHFAYDKEGVPASLTDALSRTWTFTTNKLGRQVSRTTPLAEKFVFVYDSMGRLTSATNPLLQTRNYAFDVRGLLTGITLPAGIAASFTRNDLGLITAITDPNGGFWTRSYDNMGRLTSQKDPLARTSAYTYDSRNRLSVATTPVGTATFTYDAAGNVTQRQYSDGTTLTYSYDDNGRVVSGNGLALTYDARGGIISSNGQGITYDDAGKISSITYAVGKSVLYSYNLRGLLTQVTDWVGGVTTLTYDDARQLVSLARPNGVTTQYTYDLDGRLSSITETKVTTLSSIALTRDAAGQITSADRNVPLSPALPAGSLPLRFDAAHQVTGFTYDGNGRLTHDAIRSYTWDLAGRLASYAGADGSASFTYDAFGMRTSATTSAGVLNYVVNYAIKLPSITTVRDSSGDRRYYVYLPNGVLLHAVEAADNTRHFYHFDEMGSTVFLTGDSGAITDSYGITPYGETVTKSGTTENPFTFVGARGVMQETGLGLYYMRARFYDGTTARFLSRDPAPSADPKEIDPYQYAALNPLLYIDPSGYQSASTTAPSNPTFKIKNDTENRCTPGHVDLLQIFGDCSPPGPQPLFSVPTPSARESNWKFPLANPDNTTSNSAAATPADILRSTLEAALYGGVAISVDDLPESPIFGDQELNYRESPIMVGVGLGWWNVGSQQVDPLDIMIQQLPPIGTSPGDSFGPNALFQEIGVSNFATSVERAEQVNPLDELFPNWRELLNGASTVDPFGDEYRIFFGIRLDF